MTLRRGEALSALRPAAELYGDVVTGYVDVSRTSPTGAQEVETRIGNLTRDPELRHLPSGTPVLQLGLANNGRQKDESGNWTDKPNFFDVKVFGNQAEMLAQHLAKGRRVGIDGGRRFETGDQLLQLGHDLRQRGCVREQFGRRLFDVLRGDERP